MIPISRPLIDERAEKLVLEVLRSGQLSAGQLVSELEERTAALVGVRHAIAVSSGTAALELVFESILDPGDTVITTPFTFAATVNSVLRAGGVVRFADIGDDFNMDPQDASAAASDGVDVLLPVHLFGRPCKLDAMWELTKAKEATMVEDAAQAIGAHLEGRKVGSWGIGCFSLYATKNIAAGEGGLITTDDDEVADRVRLLANQGSRHRYEYEVIGTNRRLTELQAALVLPQLDDLPTWIERRRDNAATLTEGLRDLDGPSDPRGPSRSCLPPVHLSRNPCSTHRPGGPRQSLETIWNRNRDLLSPSDRRSPLLSGSPTCRDEVHPSSTARNRGGAFHTRAPWCVPRRTRNDRRCHPREFQCLNWR